MRELIGKQIDVYMQDEGQVLGVLLTDDRSFAHVRLEDGRVKRLVKSKICSFVPVDKDAEESDYVPFHMLFCENKITGCPGVQFVQEGDSICRADFEKFMSSCPCRDDCGHGTKGELRSVNGTYLRDVFGDTMFGSYPEKKEKEEKEDAGSTGTDGETEHSQEEG